MLDETVTSQDVTRFLQDFLATNGGKFWFGTRASASGYAPIDEKPVLYHEDLPVTDERMKAWVNRWFARNGRTPNDAMCQKLAAGVFVEVTKHNVYPPPNT